MEKNNIASPITLSTSIYTATSDGYVRCGCSYGQSNYVAVTIYGATSDSNSFEVGAVGNSSSGGRFACFVRKGMRMKISANNNGEAKFYPLTS